MTTTIHADGPLSVGPPYVFASFDEIVTVLHVLVVGVFVLSLVVACAVMVVAVFSVHPGCGPSRTAVAVPLALVVSFVTGASLAAWATTGPGVGLLILAAATGLVVAVKWFMVWRERRTTAAFLAVASRDGAGEQS